MVKDVMLLVGNRMVCGVVVSGSVMVSGTVVVLLLLAGEL